MSLVGAVVMSADQLGIAKKTTVAPDWLTQENFDAALKAVNAKGSAPLFFMTGKSTRLLLLDLYPEMDVRESGPIESEEG